MRLDCVTEIFSMEKFFRNYFSFNLSFAREKEF